MMGVIPLMTALHPLFLCLANSLTETASLCSVRIQEGQVRGFLVGLGAGAVLGLLFAPKRGDETREQLRSKANDLMDMANQQSDKFKAVASKIQEHVANLRPQKPETEGQ